MAENYYNTIPHQTHRTFGGVIYPSDFEINFTLFDAPHSSDRYSTGSSIAARIKQDWDFDKQCRFNIENRTRQALKDKASENSKEA